MGVLKYFLIPLLLSQFSSQTISGDKVDHHKTLNDSPSIDRRERTTLGQLMAKEQKRQTLAELIAMESEAQSLANGTSMAQLIEMERIDRGEFEQFQQQKKLAKQHSMNEKKGMFKKMVKMFSKKKDKMKVQEENQLEEKYRNLNSLKETDPAMAQIMEKLQMHIKEVKSGKISEPLKQYFIFVIQFLAKRHQISVAEIVPIQNMKTKKVLTELVKLVLEEKRKNKQKNGKNKDINGQNCQSEKKFKSNKAKEERMLRLLLTALDNMNGTINLSMDVDEIKRKRRKKRIAHTMIFLLAYFLFALIVSILFLTINFTNYTMPTTNEFKTKLIRKNIKKALNRIPQQNISEDGEEECAICLNPFEKDQKVRPIPPCQHKFHTDCIDKWVKQHNNCPICRTQTFKISILRRAKPIAQQQEEQDGHRQVEHQADEHQQLEQQEEQQQEQPRQVEHQVDEIQEGQQEHEEGQQELGQQLGQQRQVEQQEGHKGDWQEKTEQEVEQQGNRLEEQNVQQEEEGHVEQRKEQNAQQGEKQKMEKEEIQTEKQEIEEEGEEEEKHQTEQKSGDNEEEGEGGQQKKSSNDDEDNNKE
ncbi:hypothetical protein niasHT_034422 [Heterodera trifolii]|uniref:RING-type domain-containing protein n=1 Tax=Heterodera trifolii TaxID=157864 RepID=A0ABD2HS10_9BILA